MLMSVVAISLNLFSINGAASIYLVYLTAYLMQYIGASTSHVGWLCFASNILGMPIGLMLSNLCDRHRCHRIVYLAGVAVCTLSMVIFVLPTIYNNNNTSHDPTESRQASVWFYLISGCSIVTSILVTFCLNISDTFCANIARKTGISYCSIRFWGGAAWAATSLLLVFINDLECLPFLVPALITNIVLLSSILLVLLFAPDQSGFDLSNSASERAKGGDATSFKFRGTKTVSNCSADLESSDAVAAAGRHNQVESKQVKIITLFDTDRATDRDVLCLRQNIGQLDQDQDHDDDDNEETFSLGLSLRVLAMLVRSNRLIPRFLAMYFVCGFMLSQSYFMVSYLATLSDDFKTLTPKIALSAYLAETAFYLVSPHVTQHLSFSSALSLVLVAYSLRYSLYLAFIFFKDSLSLYLFVPIELLHSVTTGWFNYVFFVSALDFTEGAGAFVPELISAGLIRKSPNAEKQVKNCIKVTMVSVSSCCFDGLGTSLGSLIGGQIIDRYNYKTLWSGVAAFALGAALINLAFHVHERLLDKSAANLKQEHQAKTTPAAIESVITKTRL